MLGHLDLEAGLEHLADQPRQQASLAGQLQSLIAATPAAPVAGIAGKI